MANLSTFKWLILALVLPLSGPTLATEAIEQMRVVLLTREQLSQTPSTHGRVAVRKEELKLIKLIGADQDLSSEALLKLITEHDQQSTKRLDSLIREASPFTQESFRNLKILRRAYLSNAYPHSPEAHHLVDALIDYNRRARRHNEENTSTPLSFVSISRESGLLIPVREEQIPLERRAEARLHFDLLEARWEFIQRLRNPSPSKNCSDYL